MSNWHLFEGNLIIFQNPCPNWHCKVQISHSQLTSKKNKNKIISHSRKRKKKNSCLSRDNKTPVQCSKRILRREVARRQTTTLILIDSGEIEKEEEVHRGEWILPPLSREGGGGVSKNVGSRVASPWVAGDREPAESTYWSSTSMLCRSNIYTQVHNDRTTGTGRRDHAPVDTPREVYCSLGPGWIFICGFGRLIFHRIIL